MQIYLQTCVHVCASIFELLIKVGQHVCSSWVMTYVHPSPPSAPPPLSTPRPHSAPPVPKPSLEERPPAHCLTVSWTQSTGSEQPLLMAASGSQVACTRTPCGAQVNDRSEFVKARTHWPRLRFQVHLMNHCLRNPPLTGSAVRRSCVGLTCPPERQDPLLNPC